MATVSRLASDSAVVKLLSQRCAHFFLPPLALPLVTFLTSALVIPPFFFLASMSWNLWKSFKFALVTLAAIFFPQVVCPNLSKVLSEARAFFSVFSRAALPIGVLKSVKLRRPIGICWRGTPVVGPSMTTLQGLIMSTMVHILP